MPEEAVHLPTHDRRLRAASTSRRNPPLSTASATRPRPPPGAAPHLTKEALIEASDTKPYRPPWHLALSCGHHAGLSDHSIGGRTMRFHMPAA